MSSKYKIGDGQYAHFVTFTVVNWIDVFTRDEYRNIIIDSLNYCSKHKGLMVHAYCIMTNHVHLIISAEKDNNLAFIVRDFKKFTSYKLLDAIKHNPFESKKEWMLWMFERIGSKNTSNERYQFWQNGYHPIELNNVFLIEQRLNYLHENPVRAGFVLSAEEYKYSSARNYAGGIDCVMEVVYV
jgi:putative transposase